MKTLKIGETIVSVLFLILSVWILYRTQTAFAVAGVSEGDPISNSALFPRIIAFLMAGASLFNIGRLTLSASVTPKDASDAQALPDTSAHEPAPISATPERRRALICLLIFCLYLFLLKPVGYDVATPVLMISLFSILGIPKVETVLAGLFTSLFMSFLFERVLNVVLPTGVLSFPF